MASQPAVHRVTRPMSIGASLTACLLVGGLLATASGPRAPTSTVVVTAASVSAAGNAVRRHGGTVDAELTIVSGVVASVPGRELAGLEADPTVSLSSDQALHVLDIPVSSRPATAVYPETTGAARLAVEGIDGRGVTVGVIDTGISRLPDFGNRLIGGVDFSGEGNPFADSFGHGTFVSGLIAGDGTASHGAIVGEAPKANLVSIKIAGQDGKTDMVRVLKAVQWALSHRRELGIRVLNLSLGTDSTQSARVSPLNVAVERAWNAGVVVVVSAGNSGPAARTITKPGDDPLVITAGAVDDHGTAGRSDDTVASFSSVGPTAADGYAKPDLLAPGRSVLSLRAPGSLVDRLHPEARVDGAYFRGSGTSFSAAITSGASALLLQAHPNDRPDSVKGRLLASAAPGPVADVNVDGRGVLDAYAAAHAGPSSLHQVRPVGPASNGDHRGTSQTATSGSAWDGSAWDGSAWDGSAWDGSAWDGSAWDGSAWDGSAWDGSAWDGSAWDGSAWDGSAWDGSAWD
jgi:serine protease AprX